jgi:hypothetical protein
VSVRATLWAWEQEAQATALLVLLAVADEADDSGTYQTGSQASLMAKTGVSERAVRDNLTRLEGMPGVLRKHPRFEDGRRLPDVIKLGVDGSLEPPARSAGSTRAGEPPAESAGGKVPAKGHRQNVPGSSSSTGHERSAGRGSARRDLPLVNADVTDELARDAQGLLDQRTKVGSRIVTPEEMSIAVFALSEFNRHAGVEHGLSAALRGIVGRVRERPSYDAQAHVRLVQSAWRIKWWARNGNGRRPTPAVIYGNAEVFERVVQDATDEKNGRTPEQLGKATAKRFVRQGPRREL